MNFHKYQQSTSITFFPRNLQFISRVYFNKILQSSKLLAYINTKFNFNWVLPQLSSIVQ